MKPLPKRLLAFLLTLALGLGLWTIAAVSFQEAEFSPGEVLSAAELNSLLNENFAEAAGAITELQDSKVDRAGDAMTGRLTIDSGNATAIDLTNNSSDNPTVSIKNEGTGPVLEVLAAGGLGLVVSSGGQVQIGNALSGDVNIRLDPQQGTVTNNVGAGLPLAFGVIDADGDILSGTSNIDVQLDFVGVYHIGIEGVDCDFTECATFVESTNPLVASTSADNVSPRDVRIRLLDADGGNAEARFQFVTFMARPID